MHIRQVCILTVIYLAVGVKSRFVLPQLLIVADKLKYYVYCNIKMSERNVRSSSVNFIRTLTVF